MGLIFIELYIRNLKVIFLIFKKIFFKILLKKVISDLF